MPQVLLVTGQDPMRVRAFLHENENGGSLISVQEYDALMSMLQSFLENAPVDEQASAVLPLLNQGIVMALTDEEVETIACDPSVIMMLQYYYGSETRNVITFYGTCHSYCDEIA